MPDNARVGSIRTSRVSSAVVGGAGTGADDDVAAAQGRQQTHHITEQSLGPRGTVLAQTRVTTTNLSLGASSTGGAADNNVAPHPREHSEAWLTDLRQWVEDMREEQEDQDAAVAELLAQVPALRRRRRERVQAANDDEERKVHKLHRQLRGVLPALLQSRAMRVSGAANGTDASASSPQLEDGSDAADMAVAGAADGGDSQPELLDLLLRRAKKQQSLQARNDGQRKGRKYAPEAPSPPPSALSAMRKVIGGAELGLSFRH